MKIGILQTDSVLEQFQTRFGSYPDMFEGLLKQVSSDLVFSVFDVEHGQYPADMDVCDAYLITGSKASVYEPLPWIVALQNYIVKLHQAKKKLIAVCFGHQLVAQALGGKTEKSSKGWGVGVHTVPIIRHKPWMVPDLQSMNIVVSHQDQVTQRPNGSELIAGSDFCPNSMYQIGDHIISIQGHPEFSKEYAQAGMANRRDKIDPQQFAQAMQSWNKSVDDIVIAKWWWKFLGN